MEPQTSWQLKPLQNSGCMMATGSGKNGGTFEIRMFPLFPGLIICTNRVYCRELPTPDNFDTRETPLANMTVTVNFGLQGLCEVQRLDGTVTTLRAGELSVSGMEKIQRQQFPQNHYEGLELYLDPETLAKEMPELQNWFGISGDILKGTYCGTNGVRICDIPATMLPEVRRLMELLLEDRASPSELRLRTLLLLSALCEHPLPESGHFYLTPVQADIARQAERILTEDLSVPHTARELANRFGVSDTSLKNYFRILYGVNFSTYVRQKRMEKAAELLTETNRSVGTIAAEVGYQNQSKFASVFRATYNCTPLEFRKVSRLSREREG